MTLLTAVQRAASEMGLNPIPSAVFGTTDRTEVELQNLVHDVAESIRDEHEWSVLKKRVSLTTSDDTPTADESVFSVPSDFDKFPLDLRLQTTRLSGPLQRVRRLQDWIDIDILGNVSSGAWIYYGGEIRVRPIVAATEQLEYAYISKHVVEASDASTKAEFSADDDTFRLPERLLKLGVIWRWRSKKGLPYAEDLETYTTALRKEIIKDQPDDTKIVLGQPHRIHGVEIAYPVNLVE